MLKNNEQIIQLVKNLIDRKQFNSIDTTFNRLSYNFNNLDGIYVMREEKGFRVDIYKDGSVINSTVTFDDEKELFDYMSKFLAIKDELLNKILTDLNSNISTHTTKEEIEKEIDELVDGDERVS